ncbi:MAG: outer membrane protein assembly factor BamA [Pseudomonadota bacterium]
MRLGSALGFVAVFLASISAFAGEFSPISEIRFQGNRKVEDAAIQGVISSEVGKPFDVASVAADVRAIWAMGYFRDVQVKLTSGSKGNVLIFVVQEKPSVRKIIVGGNDELDLDDINEVLDLKKDAILDVSQVKRNVGKIRDLYVEKGYYLAEVSQRIRKASQNQVDIVFTIQENAKVMIRRITIVGNKHIKSAKIKSVIGTQEGGYFSFLTSSGTYQEGAFQRDLMLITYLYYDEGFINVKVADPRVVLSPDKQHMYITIQVNEGEKYWLGEMNIEGDLLWPKDELLKQLTVKKGQLFSRTRLHKDVMALTDRYKDKGYAYANVMPLTNIDTTKRIVDLSFKIEKGKIVYFERINIRGNSKTRDKVIRRELKVAEGDRYSQTLLNRSKDRVMALGFFEGVNLSTTRGSSDEQIAVNIEVQERPTGTFQVGAGFSSVESFIVQAQISQNNLFGRGQRLSVQMQLSGLRQLFVVSFWEPYFLDSNWRFGFDLYNRMNNYDSFSRTDIGGTLTWGYPLTDDILVFVTYKAENVEVTTRSIGTLFGTGLTSPLPAGVQLANLYRDGFSSSMRMSIQWDKRNNRLFPTKGFFHAAWAEFASPYFGSGNSYNRFGAFSRWYHPIWGPFVFRFNSEIGLITSSEPTGVPIHQRYFVGGIFDVRGFRPLSLGPRIPVLNGLDPNETLLYFNKGGNKKLVFSAEIEFPIFEKVGIKGVVFSDAGNAFDDNESYSLFGLRHSVGFGFRWFSPIGPLRFEWGIPLARKEGEDSVVFEFTIGNPF